MASSDIARQTSLLSRLWRHAKARPLLGTRRLAFELLTF